MSKLFGLNKQERLYCRKDCELLFSNSNSLFCYPFKVVYRFREGGVPLRLLISVPKRNHKNATQRNKLKRRTRESFRLNRGIYLSPKQEMLPVDIGYIFVSKKEESYEVIETAVKKIFQQISASALKAAELSSNSPSEVL